MKISVRREDFDAGAEIRAVSRDPKVGAVASFVGVMREVAMTLEHYPGMTETAALQRCAMLSNTTTATSGSG